MDNHFLNIDPATVKGPFCLVQREIHDLVGVITPERYRMSASVTKSVKQQMEIMNADPQLN